MDNNRTNPPITRELSWAQYEHFVITKLEELGHQQAKLYVRMEQINADLIRLQMRMSMFSILAGAIAGTVPAALSVIYILLNK